ncbi:glycosyltransferase family 4 protein [Belliella aquatica]|uniref:Glycosyltransferase WbuB n=1 Tax=Belliella aquatica TaxID=1323734 RepID=A0ABQ1LLS5_9BACT|nr:glycosyltransferase family 4 protein [Belliella aquatica]MCH7404230.1 glycosyltransferase family 4 protein [Belliella aquatica]GGC26380.1 glycosyltransferase WbuB [Belliella aquatica]
MRIIYIHQYFLTPEEGGAIRSYHLAKGMVEAGIAVDMITTHNKPYYDLRIIDGIHVHYLPVAYSQEWGFVKRIKSFIHFVHLARKWVAKLPRPDYLYITSTPLTTGLIGLWAKRKFALPYIFEVRDLWPDAPIQVGAIRNPILKNILYALEKRIYKHALKCIALSPGITNEIRKRTETPISIIPNFGDTAYFTPEKKDPQLLHKLKLKDSFTILYAGAIGQVNAVEELLDIAKLAMDRGKDYQFLVMGKGSQLPNVLRKAEKLALNNFRFFDFGNKEKVRYLLNLSDMAFISFDHLPVLKTNSPNKFFDALAAGKAILVNHKGWVCELTKKYELGIYHNPTKPEQTLDKIEKMLENASDLPKFQQNARSLALQFFTKEMAVKRVLAVLDSKKFGNEFTDEVYILTA